MPRREIFDTPRLKALLAEQADGASLIEALLAELKRVAASLGDFVSVLAALCLDADPRRISVFLVRPSRAYRDQLAFDFHYTRHCPCVYILRLGKLQCCAFPVFDLLSKLAAHLGTVEVDTGKRGLYRLFYPS